MLKIGFLSKKNQDPWFFIFWNYYCIAYNKKNMISCLFLGDAWSLEDIIKSKKHVSNKKTISSNTPSCV
jgi:hypothetical protein